MPSHLRPRPGAASAVGRLSFGRLVGSQCNFDQSSIVAMVQLVQLCGSVDLGAATLAAERGRAAAERAGRGAGPPSCSRKAARGGAATLGAELRA